MKKLMLAICLVVLLVGGCAHFVEGPLPEPARSVEPTKVSKPETEVEWQRRMDKLAAEQVENEAWEKMVKEIEADKIAEERAEERSELLRTGWPKRIQQLILDRQLGLGMTKEQAQMCMVKKQSQESWYKSPVINRTVGSCGIHEQWVYEFASKTYYLYFENSILTSWQN